MNETSTSNVPVVDGGATYVCTVCGQEMLLAAVGADGIGPDAIGEVMEFARVAHWASEECTADDVDDVELVLLDPMPVRTTTLMPPAADACPTCAREHDPAEPHDAQSLYWAMARKMAGKPEPTWREAMAHCEPQVITDWTEKLGEMGVDLDAAGGGQRLG